MILLTTAADLNSYADQRSQRQGFIDVAHPQHGVDAMADQFHDTTPLPLPGVVDAAAGRGQRAAAVSDGAAGRPPADPP